MKTSHGVVFEFAGSFAFSYLVMLTGTSRKDIDSEIFDEDLHQN